MVTKAAEGATLSLEDALRTRRQGGITLLGQLDWNQGKPTFTGRLTLEQFADLTVVHNKRWADEAGETVDVVTQREIIDGHANGLAGFMLQGLISAAIQRAAGPNGSPEPVATQLAAMHDRVGRSSHYGIPQVTLVLRDKHPQVRPISDGEEVVAHRLLLPPGTLLVVADGQHRREAARRVKEFLTDVIGNRRVSGQARFYQGENEPIDSVAMDAWMAVNDIFRTETRISFEAHIGLTTDEARQMFTNYNCHVKPVKADVNLEFDQSNPINAFAKDWLASRVRAAGGTSLDIRQMAQVNGFLFLGKTSIRSAPFHVESLKGAAMEFWETVLTTSDWSREGSLLHEVAVLKGIAKAWFFVFLAKRNKRPNAGEQIRKYIRLTRFDEDWVGQVPGLDGFTITMSDGRGIRFQPSHNEIVALIVDHSIGAPEH